MILHCKKIHYNFFLVTYNVVSDVKNSTDNATYHCAY